LAERKLELFLRERGTRSEHERAGEQNSVYACGPHRVSPSLAALYWRLSLIPAVNGRSCCGHPRLDRLRNQTWMPVPSNAEHGHDGGEPDPANDREDRNREMHGLRHL